jgi:ABC-2 type transport system permease protein
MLRDAFFLAWMDVRHLFRYREIWVWVFALPITFAYFFGTILSGSYGESDAPDLLTLRAPADAGFLADHLVRQLEARHYQVQRVDDPEEWAHATRRLTIPAGFTATVLAGQSATIAVERNGGGLGTDYDTLRLSRAIYAVLGDLIVVTQDGETATPEALRQLAEQPRRLTLKVEPAGQRQEIPTGFEQSVPGSLVFLVLLILLSGGVSLTIERERGILRRLASSPMRRGAIVLGKGGAWMLVGMIQIGFAMITSTVLFGIRWGPHLPTIVAVLFAYASLAAALGMLLGNLGRTQGQVLTLGLMISNALACLGGCLWPIEITPEWTQRLALFLPTGWAMDALHRLMSFGASPVTVLPHLAALSLSALGAGYLVARSFRFQ